MKRNVTWIIGAAVGLAMLNGCGKGGLAGYRNDWMYPQDIQTVYVEMFDSSGFRRVYEFRLTDAVCKRLEAQTPYKIVSDRDIADSILSGTISTSSSTLSVDRYTGKPLEREAFVRVRLTWKNLRTGQMILDREDVYASTSYSAQLGQSFEYSANASLNKAAQKVVERMEIPW